MVTRRLLEADMAIFLPEFASSRTWCLPPSFEPADDPDDPGPLILIARREFGCKYDKDIGGGLRQREDVFWRSATTQHDFWVPRLSLGARI